MTSVLSLEGICKSFGALAVARDISLELATGARHALIGPNGAGKTTLVNLVSGLLRPSAGRISLGGTDITQAPPERRVALGLARTFQITSLFPTLTVAENVGLALSGHLKRDGQVFGRVRGQTEIVDGAAALLDRIGLLPLASMPVSDLPYGQRRLVEIALVLALEPTLLLLDEPAAGLASEDRSLVLDLLLRLPHDLTILIIEHDMSVVFRLAEQITVLVEGAILLSGTPQEIRTDRRVRDVYLGRAPMAEALAIDHITAGYRDTVVIEDTSLAVASDEALAVLGRNGVGKTTLLMTIMGLTSLRAGSIRFAGQDITTLDTHARARLGLGPVPQEREIFPSLTVDENLRVGARPGNWTAERAYDLFPRLAERRRNYGNQLSGGEQQMLAVGRALAGNPTLLLLDEPFEGLAPVIVDTLAAALDRLRRESRIATILVEQQVGIALELTDNAVVLDKGQIVWRGTSTALAADEESLATLVGLQ